MVPIVVKSGDMTTTIKFSGVVMLRREAEKGYYLTLEGITPQVSTNAKDGFTWYIPPIPFPFKISRATILAETKIDGVIKKKINDMLSQDTNGDGVADLKQPLVFSDPGLYADALMLPIYASLAKSNIATFKLSSQSDGVPVLEVVFKDAIVGSWLPHKEEHPRLLYGPSDRERLRSRISITPYGEWYERIRKQAAAEPLFPPVDEHGILSREAWAQEVANAHIARSAALVFDLEGDRADLYKALVVLNNFQHKLGDPPFTLEWSEKSLQTSDILLSLSQTYDLLLGQGFPSNISAEEIRENRMGLPVPQYLWVRSGLRLFGLNEAQRRLRIIVESRLTDLQSLTYLHTHAWMFVPNQNFILRNAAALGASAIVLNHRQDAYENISLAVSAIWKTLGVGAGGAFDDPSRFTKQTEYGGFGEGPAYLQYSAELYLPFMLAYHRFIAGEPANQTFTYSDWLTQYDLVVPDLISSDRVRRIHEWNLRIALPNGQSPNIKDTDRGYFFYSGLLANDLVDDPVAMKQVWAADAALAGYASGSRLVEYFVYYDHSLFDDTVNPGLVFGLPSSASAEEGNIVMRSDWGVNALYLHLLADHRWVAGENPEIIGGVRYPNHQQEDNTSFLIYGYGDYLAIDSGYGSFPLRGHVGKATNHNVVLVDGQGPKETTEAFLIDVSRGGLTETATVSSTYENATVTRSAVFVDNRYFVVVDEVRSATSHRYDWQLHGNNNPDTPNSLRRVDGSYLWTTPAGRQLLVHVSNTSPGGVDTFVERAAVHFVGHTSSEADLQRHTVVEAREDSAVNLNYLAVLFPSDGAGALPQVASFVTPGLFAGASVSGTDYTDLFFTEDPAHTAFGIYDIAVAGLPSIRTDADFLFLRVAPGNLRLIGFSGRNMSYLQVNGKEIVTTPVCATPNAGDWEVGADCTIIVPTTVKGDVLVANGVELIIATGAVLDVDFTQHRLLIQPGGRLIIRPGGTLR